ncbi:MAG: hypothetical protein Q8Q09_26045 [Deltaproteobacteria bacterium]|nr:hypothetical protein [Deltaproteobacteria bacterium]
MATDEQSVRTDAPTLHFRKRYFAELEGSHAGAESSARRRALPVVSAVPDRAANDSRHAPALLRSRPVRLGPPL